MLTNKLEGLTNYPFHMPGHKRNTELFKMDFTEIEGADDLHHPKGILKEAMDHAADIYGVKKTYFLINGSTCGILAAMGAVLDPGDRILAARNCHKSVYNGIYIMGLKPSYVYPENVKLGISGGISPEDVERELIKTGAKAFIMVSPTYEGMTSDIEKISGVCHRHDCILIVDEAHGAHFPFHSAFPTSAVSLGADIVIQSLHKTLPALTQTALLHICSRRISSERVEKYLDIFESSSPSYILLGSIDSCIRYMTSSEGRIAMERYVSRLTDFRRRAEGLILEDLKGRSNICGTDISKIIIPGGREVMEKLRSHGLEAEMANACYCLAMTSVGDTDEGFERLFEALSHMPAGKPPEYKYEFKAEISLAPTETAHMKSKGIYIENALGKTAAKSIYIYPPGIPIAAPGEIITENVIKIIKDYIALGFEVIGAENSLIYCIEA